MVNNKSYLSLAADDTHQDFIAWKFDKVKPLFAQLTFIN